MRDIRSKLKLASLLNLGNAENSLNCGFSFTGHSEPCKIWSDPSEKIREQGRKSTFKFFECLIPPPPSNLRNLMQDSMNEIQTAEMLWWWNV